MSQVTHHRLCHCWECRVISWLDKLPSRRLIHQTIASSGAGAMPRRSPLGGPVAAASDAAPDDTPRSALPASQLTSSPAKSARTGSEASFQNPQAKRPRRSTTPLKIQRQPQLEWLTKPITMTPICEPLPEDVRQLHARILQINLYRLGIIPDSAQPITQSEVAGGSGWPDWWFGEETEEESTFWVQGTNESNMSFAARKRQRARQQFTALHQIQRDAAECLRRGRSEAAWNVKVHGPLLELAARDRRAVVSEVVTTARIAPQWLPSAVGGGPVDVAATASMASNGEDGDGVSKTTAYSYGTSSTTVAGKMVDFALVLDLNPFKRFEPLAGPVRQLLMTQPHHLRYINQSLHDPLTYSPIGISIETKPNGTLAHGRTQLGICTAAWHRRISELIPPGSKITTLPLVLAGERAWDLYFACDEETSIQIVGPMHIGSTDDMASSYALLAVLRELVAWVDTQFRQWVATTLLASV